MLRERHPDIFPSLYDIFNPQLLLLIQTNFSCHQRPSYNNNNNNNNNDFNTESTKWLFACPLKAMGVDGFEVVYGGFWDLGYGGVIVDQPSVGDEIWTFSVGRVLGPAVDWPSVGEVVVSLSVVGARNWPTAFEAVDLLITCDSDIF